MCWKMGPNNITGMIFVSELLSYLFNEKMGHKNLIFTWFVGCLQNPFKWTK